MALMIIYGVMFVVNIVALASGNLTVIQFSGFLICCAGIALIVFASIGVNISNDPLYLGRDEGRQRGKIGDFLFVFSWIIVGVSICIGSCVCCLCCVGCLAVAGGAYTMDETQAKAMSAFFGEIKMDAEQTGQEVAVCLLCGQDMTGATDVCELNCADRHVYHVECVKKWTEKKNSCP